MKKTWVVAAETGCARIFLLENRVAPLKEIDELSNPVARAHERDLISDRPGRAFDSAGQGRHSMEPQVDPKQQEAIAFAKKINERLEQGRTRGDFEELILIAPPEFLGILRHNINGNTAKCVAKTISKRLVQKKPTEIREYLFS